MKEAVDQIPNWTFDDKDIAPVRKLSMALAKSKLPSSVRARTASQIIKAAQVIMDDDTVYFNFDEVKDVIGLIRDFVPLPDDIAKSAKGFLERWVGEDFGNELDNVYDTDDLDEFVKILDEMLIEFNANVDDLSDKIDSKRQALLDEDDESDNSSPYVPVTTANDLSITDREIQSMFEGLRTNPKKW